MVDALLRRLSRIGLRRALAGEHWAWAVLAVAAFVLRRSRRPVDDAVSLRVRPGERYVVTLTAPGSASDVDDRS